MAVVFLPSLMHYNGHQKVLRSAKKSSKRLQKRTQKHNTRVNQVLKQHMRCSLICMTKRDLLILTGTPATPSPFGLFLHKGRSNFRSHFLGMYPGYVLAAIQDGTWLHAILPHVSPAFRKQTKHPGRVSAHIQSLY